MAISKEIDDNRSLKLEKNLSLTKATFEFAPVGLLVVDQNNKILLYNQKFIELWEISSVDLLNQDQATELFKYMQTKATATLEFTPPIKQVLISEVELKNGTCLEQIINTKFSETEVPGIIYSFHDISQRKNLEKQLEQQAAFDILTGLPNRHLLIDRLQQNIAFAKRNNGYIATLFIDLDSFKAVNDTFGHNVGDQLLQIFGQRLKQYIREHDTVARLSGDEFVVLITSATFDLKYFYKIVERFFERIIEPYNLANQEIIVTASMGISFYPQDGQDPDTLIKNADIAMYHVKEQGKNTFEFYNKAMSEQLLERLQLENGLHTALQKNEFSLNYQPIIDLKNNKIVAMEALLRWQHPKLGLIPPNTFIPVAESTGTIFPIGLWVLKTACAQLKSWHNNNLPLIKISVNISERQLRETDFVKTVELVLKETRLEAKYLEIEMAERVFLSSGNVILPTLMELKQLGIGINIDDFGTCYSKLSLVKQFPVDAIKIDRTFIKEVDHHPGIKAIVQSMATVANNLHLNVIAEGVETKEQLEVLSKLFTNEAQGYYFGKPTSAEEAGNMLIKDQN
ncbi:MAG: EAL domain-containing protein [Gammaproteobacteria bacterium]